MNRFKHNKQFVVGIGFILCLFFLLPSQVLASEITAENIFKEINIERQKKNIPDLTFNDTLIHIAEIRANDMIVNNYFSHKNKSGLMPWDIALQENYNYQIIGENLALDWINTDEAVKAWMNSSDHKKNILNQKYNETGIAVITNNTHTLIVQIFGRQQPSPTTILPAVKANSTNINIQANINKKSTTNEQTVLTIIPKNNDTENKQVLGTTYIPINTVKNDVIIFNEYLLLLTIISFFSINLFIFIIKSENI